MSELDCKTYSVFEIHPRATPKPSLTSRDHLHGRRGRAAARWAHALAPPCISVGGVCVRDKLFTRSPNMCRVYTALRDARAACVVYCSCKLATAYILYKT